MNSGTYLIFACLAMVALTLIVGLRMLFSRVTELRKKRMHMQAAAATSREMASQMQDIQAADNFRNLFEVPVLFYALIAVAIGLGHAPAWLVAGAWVFVLLRYIHSFIHCTYNKVLHRFLIFGSSFLLVVALWVAFVVTLPVKNVL